MWKQFGIIPAKTTREIEIDDLEETGVTICGMYSDWDITHPNSRKFYFDYAQMEAGLERTFGISKCGFLKQDFDQLKKGTLVLIVYFDYELDKIDNPLDMLLYEEK